MLNNLETILMHRAATALLETQTKPNKALANEINESLVASGQAKARIGKAQADRPRAAASGRPALAFAIALQPGWRAVAHGGAAAVEVVNKELKSAGLARTTQAAMQQAISRNGQWQRTLETENGVAVLSVRRDKSGNAP